jgi:hypothetical protein
MGKTLKFGAKNPNQGINVVQIEYLNFMFSITKVKDQTLFVQNTRAFCTIKQAMIC